MRVTYLILFQLLFTLNLAMSAEKTTDLNEHVVNSFMEYYKYGIDEKLYLQTDKPYYSAGEDIWFKGFLVNAITHVPFDLSNFIYVELTDTEGEIYSRVKVKRDSTAGFSGYIKLDPEMTVGEFSIRAYTKWMTNSDPDLFFQKNITIISPIPEESQNSDSKSGGSSAKERRVAAKEEKIREAQKLEYNLQFFPEGGGLVAGVPQLVAFKALAEDGLSIELKGSIYNSKDEVVANIETFNDGMGYVQLSVPAGEQYYAEVRSAEYVSKRFNLPLSSSSEVALKVSRVGTNIYYQALTGDPALLDSMSVVIHSRGKIVTVDAMDPGMARRITVDNLYDGVSVISLVNKSREVVSERIIFKRPSALPTVVVTPNSSNYAMRERATINLQIKGSDGQPASGEFAVSVVDSGAITQDSLADNAISYLLLSSEIKGHIENPGAYFKDNSKLSDSKLDLLMMTQGWRRFDLEKILDPTTQHRRPVQYEDVVNLNGEVKGFFGNDARKPKLTVMCQKLNFWDTYEMGNTNKFSFVDINVPDSVVYVIQSEGRWGGKSLTLKLDQDVYPDPKAATMLYRQREVVPFSFINQSVEKFYNDGGMTMIQLESVTVETKKPSRIEHSDFATKSSDREDLEAWGSITLRDLMYTYNGFQVRDTDITYRGSPVSFYVNGMEEEFINIDYITVDLIEEIAFFDATAASGIFFNAQGGVFSIALLDGASIPRVRRPNIANYAPLGYQYKRVFYEPTYETKSKKENLPGDYRTTIYWSGDITPNENGEVDFSFYTADKSTKYMIVVEGVTDGGEVCHSEYIINRNK